MLGPCGENHNEGEKDMKFKLTSTHRVTWKNGGKQNKNGNYAAMQLDLPLRKVRLLFTRIRILEPYNESGIEAGECPRSTCHYASRTGYVSKSPWVGLVRVAFSSLCVEFHGFLDTQPGSWLCNSRCGRADRVLGTPGCTSSVRLRRLSRTVVPQPRDLLRLGHRLTIVRLTWNHGAFRVLAGNDLFKQRS